MSTPRLDQKGFFTRDGHLEKVYGSFEDDGAGNIIAVVGKGFTATTTGAGTGLYDVVFDDDTRRLVNASATLEQIAAAVDMIPQLGAFTAGVGGVASVRIRTKTAGANAGMAATDRLHFEFTIYGNALDA